MRDGLLALFHAPLRLFQRYWQTVRDQREWGKPGSGRCRVCGKPTTEDECDDCHDARRW